MDKVDKVEKNTTFQILPADGYVVIKLNGKAGTETARLFEKEILKLVAGPPYNHVIVNCNNLSDLSKSWIQCLVQLVHGLEKVNREARFIMVSSEITKSFINEGVSRTLRICPNLRDALAQFNLTTKKALDIDFINPFLDAALQVLKVQFQTEAKAGKVYVKKADDKFSGDISGVIGLVSATFNGSVVISFPEATFLKLMSRMLGENFTELTQDITDGAGELTNMIFGQAKIVLNEKGYGINTALPSVITGKGHSVSSLTNGPIVVVPFETDIGPFFIEICISG